MRNERGAMSMALIIILSVLGFFALIVGTYAIQWITADARGSISAREKTRANGDFRIAAYDHFFDLCGQIKTQEGRIQIFEDDTSQEGQTNLRAIKATRLTLINQYNADATKTDTKGHFQSSHLPYQIDPNEETTTCAA